MEIENETKPLPLRKTLHSICGNVIALSLLIVFGVCGLSCKDVFITSLVIITEKEQELISEDLQDGLGREH